MYDDTILPVRNKVRIPNRSQTRLYFVQEETKKSLFCIKWLELVACLLCLCFGMLVINTTDITNLNKIVIILTSPSSILVVMVEITYPYFKKPLPLLFQIASAGTNFVVNGILTIIIYKTDINHDLVKALLFLDGFTSVLFLIDFICKIIISTYLYQTTRVKTVVDVAVSAFLPSPAPARSKPPRSALTVTPITYGGTFPVGKNQPPFLPEDRNPHAEGCTTPEKGSRHRYVQTPQYGDGKGIGGPTATYDFGPSSVERLIGKNRAVQIYVGQDDKGTSVVPPFYLEEERRKKSPWTCSTPTTSRKIEARKQASMSTPITYSGTFAVNRELVPITPIGIAGTSPKSSPRNRKQIGPRSEENSPRKVENNFVDLNQLDHISEEKMSVQMSSENCSLSTSNCAFYEAPVLPGSILEESD